MMARRIYLAGLTTALFLSGWGSPSQEAQSADEAGEIRASVQRISGGFVAAARVAKNNLWAVGREGDISDARTPSVIVNSMDMGFTWTRKMLIPECCLHNIYFISPQVGWAVGAGILHTSDGGQTWIKQRSSTAGQTLEMVRFISQRKGWTVGPGGEVLRTVDGGAHWAMSKLPSGWVKNEFKGWLNSFSFADEFNGWILGDHDQAYQTTDGGASWHSRSLQLRRALGSGSPAIPDFKEVRFFTRDVGFMIVEYLDTIESESNYVVRSSTLAILKTENGGRRWALRGKFKTRPFVRAYLLSEDEWWLQISSSKFLVRTIDSGKTWTEVELPDQANGGVMLFVDSKTIWMLSHAAGFDGSNLLTRDGGETWERQRITYRTPN